MKINISVQTKSKSIPIIQRKKIRIKNPISDYFLNAIKNRKIISDYNNNLKTTKIWNKNNSVIMNNTKINKNVNSNSIKQKNKDTLPKLPQYNYKYFYNKRNKNNFHKSLSNLNGNSIEKEKTNLETNFMRLNKDSNIYTSNAGYIKNKKLVIIDKFSYDNNKYRPDRLGRYDMLDIPRPKMQMGKGLLGKIYYNHNKYAKQKDNENKNIII